jgi:condensin complex subunit 1
MCVSPNFCKQHIGLLLGFLKKDNIDPVIKNNILITLGDLLHRHPNVIEPYSDYLYSG